MNIKRFLLFLVLIISIVMMGVVCYADDERSDPQIVADYFNENSLENVQNFTDHHPYNNENYENPPSLDVKGGAVLSTVSDPATIAALDSMAENSGMVNVTFEVYATQNYSYDPNTMPGNYSNYSATHDSKMSGFETVTGYYLQGTNPDGSHYYSLVIHDPDADFGNGTGEWALMGMNVFDRSGNVAASSQMYGHDNVAKYFTAGPHKYDIAYDSNGLPYAVVPGSNPPVPVNPQPTNPPIVVIGDPIPEMTNGTIWTNHGISNLSFSHMTATPKSTISSSIYDVETAIPTSENLNMSMETDDHLYYVNRRKHTFSAGYDSTGFRYEIRAAWDEEVHHDAEPAEYSDTYPYELIKEAKDAWDETVHHDVCKASWSESDSYSKTWGPYYDVNVSNVYPATKGTVNVSNGSQTISVNDLNLNGTGGPGPSTFSWASTAGGFATYGNHYVDRYDNPSDGDAKGGWDGLVGSAHGAVNGAWSFSNTGVSYNFGALSVTWTSSTDNDPGWGTAHSEVRVKMIPDYFDNGKYSTYAVARYSGGQTFDAPGTTRVVVHTPVVSQSIKVKATPFINQKATIDSSINYLQLDEGFSITIPNTGTHISAKGYGTRKYNSMQAVTKKVTDWGEVKDVKLPFDVYVYNKDFTKTYYLPANNWLREYSVTKNVTDLSSTNEENETTYNFIVPVWAKEGLYNTGSNQIAIRVIAENAYDKDRKIIASKLAKQEQGANLSINNYVTYQYFPCEVIGKIYDFNVLDSSDPGWQGKGGTIIGGGFVPLVSAQNLPYGVTKTPVATKVATTSQNRTQTYNYAQKLGYTFVFDFKTKGRNTTNVTIGTAGTAGNEEFYFIGKNTNTVKSVYLYYKDADGVYKKIKSGMGSAYQTKDLEINLNDSFFKVTPQEKTDTNRIYVAEKVAGAPFNYAVKINIGTLAALNIPQKLRFAYNNMNEYKTDAGGKGLYKQTEANIISHAADAVTKTYGFTGESGKDLVTGSVGHWYVGYALPSSTVAVDPGKIPPGSTEKDIDTIIKNNPSQIVIKGGYIGVGFNFDPTVPTNLDYNGPEYTNADGSIPNKDEKSTLLKGGTVSEGQLTKPTRNWVDATGSTIPGVPNDVVILYETDWTTQIDNHSVLAK